MTINRKNHTCIEQYNRYIKLQNILHEKYSNNIHNGNGEKFEMNILKRSINKLSNNTHPLTTLYI